MATKNLESIPTVDLLEELKRRYNCLAKPEGRYIFVGAPGSGKGTQSQKLKMSHCYCHLSTGDMLREAVSAGTTLGEKVKAVIEVGDLVSDDMVLGLIDEKLQSPECQRGFVLDGFPRNLTQAKSLTSLLSKLNQNLDGVIHFDVPDNELVDRVCGRRVHPSSGRVYHIENSPPKIANKDDVTGEPLIHRKDDNEETLRKRLSVFNNETKPVIDYYSKLGLLYTLDGTKGSGDVSNQMYSYIDGHHPKSSHNTSTIPT